jgi:uncharacterized protein (PEP-CTERM system associated)
MAIMVMDTALNRKILAATIIAVLSANACSAEWQFTPQLVIDETYSDNVNLSINNKVSSLVSQTGLDLNTVLSSKNLELNFSSKSIYAMYSHNHDIDNDFHTLDTNFRLKLAPKGLVLMGNAGITNQSKNTSSNALADIVSGDTVSVENYSTGLEYSIDNSDFIINSRIQYRLTQSEDNIGERKGYSIGFVSTNGSAARHVFWEARSGYSDNTNQGQDGTFYTGEIKFGLITSYKVTPFLRYYEENNEGDLIDNSSSIESDSFGGGLRWLISSKLLLDISHNKPTGSQLGLDGKEQEDYSAVSIQWVPSQRTDLKFDYGQRFYGKSYGLNFTHKNKRLTNKITYVEDVRAFTRNNYQTVEQGSYWCPQGEIIDVSSCFVDNNQNINFDDYQLVSLNDFVLIEDLALSLNKQLNWSSELQLSRTSFALSLSSLSRENLNTRVNDENRSASFTIKRKVSGKSNIQLSIKYNNNHFALNQDSERQDRYRSYSIEYDKSLNSELTFKIGISHLNRSSIEQSFNYEEDRITLNFSKGF